MIDSYFETHGFGPYQKTLQVILSDMDAWKRVTSILPKDYKVQNFGFNTKNKEYIFSIIVNADKEEMNKLPLEMMKIKEVVSFKVD